MKGVVLELSDHFFVHNLSDKGSPGSQDHTGKTQFTLLKRKSSMGLFYEHYTPISFTWSRTYHSQKTPTERKKTNKKSNKKSQATPAVTLLMMMNCNTG